MFFGGHKVAKILYIAIYIALSGALSGALSELSDMILTPFDGKFNEKKDEIPPGACRPPYSSKYSILGI